MDLMTAQSHRTGGCYGRAFPMIAARAAGTFLSIIFVLLLGGVASVWAQAPAMDEARPIEAVDSVFIEDLTWMEVRDAIAEGKKTVIVASGGMEQNGPYLVTGKHNVVLEAMTESIARELGDALVAPILKLVPEGDFDPPSGHMRYPGTVGLSQETFKAVVGDVCRSLKVHGFTDIVLIGDSGGNQRGMKEVAEALNRSWAGNPSVHFIPEFYDYEGVGTFLEKQGVQQESEGLHDDFGITSIMMTVDPASVRLRQREAKGLAKINGVPISPASKAIEMGKKVVGWRTQTTVSAIRKAIGGAITDSP